MSDMIKTEDAKEAFRLTINQVYDHWDPCVDWNKVYEDTLRSIVSK